MPVAFTGSGISAPYPNVPSTLVRSTRVVRVTATAEPARGGAAGPSSPPPRPSAPTTATAVTSTKAAATRTVRLRRRPGARRGGAVPSVPGSVPASVPVSGSGSAPPAVGSPSVLLPVNMPFIAQPLPGPCSTGSPMIGAQARAACLAAAVVESHWTSP